MKIAVAGATGRVGRHIVAVLGERGDEPVPISRSNGVDVITSAGLAEALAAAYAVIDAATGPSPEQQAKHPGLAETRLIDLGDGNYIDTWRWKSPAQMGAAFADVANIPEVPAAMSLTQNASAEDGSVIDAR